MAIATIATSASRDRRGIKRMCITCEIPFYDLSHDPIVCPACGGEHTPVVKPIIELRKIPQSPTSSWRSRTTGRTDAAIPSAEASEGAQDGVLADDVVVEDLEEASPDIPGAASDDDTVLEQETDDADASALIERDDDDPKDQ